MRKLFATILLCLAGTAAQAEDWVIKPSPYDVATTADRLEGIIDASPASLVARVDHQAAAAGADLQMDPATVLIFGNPALGTPLMQADPRAALDLPLRVLVWQDADGAKIGYLSVEALAERYDLDSAKDTLERMKQALASMTDKAVAED
ncbi:DUF302 domain-containing protein [Falsirhodobacter algicola]|uniref:DUF302 domain-containing protein n=1 Tax=Falsirhodobacter algicola TaxID=2692330 RepID=A0A8J8MVH4_9RHOB|nr:DUF302 domain-containing protein [Falsirhodobacter algicola]QUS37023.1 DUF302 domain-containing protein [Falsirhodobacter algicola]